MIKSVCAALAAVLAIAPLPSHAALIFSADSVATSAVNPAVDAPWLGPVERLIDQSGLVTPYVSGVTDFSAYVAVAEAVSGTQPATERLASLGKPLPIVVDFFFASSVDIAHVAIWNQAGSASLEAFRLFSTADGSFTDLALVADTSVPQATTLGLATVIDIAAPASRGIRMEILSTHGFSPDVRFNEIAFGGDAAAMSAIPVPAAAWLLAGGFGLLATGGRRDRRTN